MLVCLVNKPSSSLCLDLTTKQVKLKHNNVFMNMRFDLTINKLYFYMHICIKIWLHRFEIGWYKFVYRFIWYQIIICSSLIIKQSIFSKNLRICEWVKNSSHAFTIQETKKLIKYLANKFEFFQQQKNKKQKTKFEHVILFNDELMPGLCSK